MIWADLGRRDQDAFIKLLELPALWAFAVVAAQIGMDNAFEHLDLEDLPAEVLSALRTGGWGAHHLPRRHAVESLLLAVRLTVRLKRDKTLGLSVVADRLGIPQESAFAALRVLEGYAGPAALAGVR